MLEDFCDLSLWDDNIYSEAKIEVPVSLIDKGTVKEYIYINHLIKTYLL